MNVWRILFRRGSIIYYGWCKREETNKAYSLENVVEFNLIDKRKGGIVREDISKYEFEGDLYVEVNELVELCRNIYRYLGMYKWSLKVVIGLGLYI